MTLTFEHQEDRAEVLAEVQRLKAEASRMVIRCNLIFDISKIICGMVLPANKI